MLKVYSISADMIEKNYFLIKIRNNDNNNLIVVIVILKDLSVQDINMC